MTEPRFDNSAAATENVPLPDVREMPGRQALLMAALALGLLMLGIQLWLLTVALELYLSGEGKEIWGLALVSGIVFGGGVLTTWLLSATATQRATAPTIGVFTDAAIPSLDGAVEKLESGANIRCLVP